MQPNRTRRTAAATALALITTLVLSGTASAAATRQTVPVGWHPQSGTGLVAGATATLVRQPNGVSFRLQTSNLNPGHAYTVWFVVINNPDACSATPCSGPDILLNSATQSQVTYGAGNIAGGNGTGAFGGAFRAGPVDGWLPNGFLGDPMTVDIHLVLNDHGPALAAYMPGMIHTYRGGCSDASPFPTIFPATALADGEVGPNTCRLYQAAVFDAP